MREKTEFQKKCSDLFLTELQGIGISCDKWSFVDGKQESFFEASVAKINIWIYDDGACIKTVNKTKILEALDYKNEDELIDDFINSFKEFLEREIDK